MKAYSYDFHIHSCLSPCGDADMTPNNIVNMAKLNGLDAIAVTDHNSCSNCAAAVRVGEEVGLLVLPGMELCTREEVHVVCLFTTVDGARNFAAKVYPLIPDIKNRPDIFGEQLILDELDRQTGREEKLLISAADIGVNDVWGLAAEYGGVAFPAHADKSANGIIQILGSIPPEAGFASAELSPQCDPEPFIRENSSLRGMNILTDSDAHYLWQIAERDHFMHFPELSAASIIDHLTKKAAKK